MQVTVEIPDQFFDSLVPEGQDAARLLFEQSVASAYRERRLSLEQVRELLLLANHAQADAFLRSQGICEDTPNRIEFHMPTLEEAQAAGARIRELSNGLTLGGLTIRELIDEGRR